MLSIKLESEHNLEKGQIGTKKNHLVLKIVSDLVMIINTVSDTKDPLTKPIDPLQSGEILKAITTVGVVTFILLSAIFSLSSLLLKTTH